MNREIFWAIVGRVGLYTGTFFTKFDAIDHHTKALGKTWHQCRRDGDRAVKVTISWTNPQPGRKAMDRKIKGAKQ